MTWAFSCCTAMTGGQKALSVVCRALLCGVASFGPIGCGTSTAEQPERRESVAPAVEGTIAPAGASPAQPRSEPPAASEVSGDPPLSTPEAIASALREAQGSPAAIWALADPTRGLDFDGTIFESHDVETICDLPDLERRSV